MLQILESTFLTRFFLLSTLLFFIGCNASQSKISNATSVIESFENEITEFSSDDWLELENVMLALDKDVTENKEDFSEEQLREVRKLQGRYVAILVKKGLNDFKESVKDLGNQMEGFIEGVEDK